MSLLQRVGLLQPGDPDASCFSLTAADPVPSDFLTTLQVGGWVGGWWVVGLFVCLVGYWFTGWLVSWSVGLGWVGASHCVNHECRNLIWSINCTRLARSCA